MATSLKHVNRYREIATLLLKHLRRDGVRADGDVGADVGTDDGGAADAEKLAADLEAMGPTFVKLGQLLSTRSDLLSVPYLDALARLQDDVDPFSFADVERIVEEGVGARISKAFQSFDHEPLAAASLGQVHRAVLRDGRAVAVKVQRPGVRERVRDDMEVIEELAGFVDSHTKTGRQFGFGDMVGEFKASIAAELDYRQEAAHLRLLGEHLAGHDALVVPQPVDSYTTSTVLTMELVAGRNIASLGPLALTEVDAGDLVDVLFRAYLQQILENGFVHADPHPGNVLLTDDGRLALIDLGMVARLSPDLQDSLIRLLLAVSEGRGDQVADVLVSIGAPARDFDADRFRRSINTLVLRYQYASLGEIETGRVIGELTR
ncbi:MAG: AarF/UbiB family protein, partial [Actinomycetota bacterium]|nr:AarF/UbiB family protein [Actinomycetota bacterium]